MISNADLSAVLCAPNGASAAELREMRSKLSVADAERGVSELEAVRRKALINGSDQDVDRIEKDLGRAKREVERTVAAVEELDARIVAAEKAELNAELDAAIAEATAQCRHMGEDFDGLRKNLDEAARAIARIWDRRSFIKDTNERVVMHGRRHTAVPTPYSLFSSSTMGKRELPVEVFLLNPTILVMGSPDGYRFGWALDALAAACRVLDEKKA